MPILGTIASSTRQGQSTDSGVMYPLQVITVGAAGATSINFTNIPNTYTHLQLRYISRNTDAAYYVRLNFNNNTTLSNYSYHLLSGDGTNVSVGGAGSSGEMYMPRQSTNANTFGAGVVDILDYANTNKNKTVRGIGGYDQDGQGAFDFNSGTFYQTAAITSIQLTVYAGSFTNYSQFALYGLKVA